MNQAKIKQFKVQAPIVTPIVSFSGIIIIPVVVHIIHNNPNGSIGGYNISTAQIESQIKVINEDFRRKKGTFGYNTDTVGADIEIEFQLAKVDPNCNPTDGITRTYTSQKSFNPYSDEIKAVIYWPSNEYLNIWVGNLEDNTLGIAQFPSNSGLVGLDSDEGNLETDGVVVNYKSFGVRKATSTKDIYNYGRTTTHEIGHWLGLLHTWGDTECGNDYCNDTPQAKDGNLVSDCRNQTANCFGTSNKVMIENYMDYSPDICMNIFTKDQKTRMRQAMTHSPSRANMLKFMKNGVNTKCISPIVTQLPFYEDFENLDTNTINFSANCEGEKSRLANHSTAAHANFFNSGLLQNNLSTFLLSFDYAYPNQKVEDTLFIFGNTGCITDKFIIASFTGDDLISSTENGASFTPSCQAWKQKQFFFNTEYSYFNIEFSTNKNLQQNLYIDNLRIKSDYQAPVISPQLTLKILGNPIRDNILRTEITYKEISKMEIEIFDILGNKVFRNEISEAIPGLFDFELKQLNAGLFFVKVKVNNETVSERVLFI